MRILPKALEDVIEALSVLPGVGPRSAERYAYYLLKTDNNSVVRISDVLANLQANISYCKKTFALIEKGRTVSELYSSPERDKKIVIVVAEPLDIVSIENTGVYKGTYHVLGGLVSPIDGIHPEQLHIAELVKRIDEDGVKEVILATNASAEGESTALYIQQQIGDRNTKISRLARGIPVGVDIEYADRITLSRALEGRTIING